MCQNTTTAERFASGDRDKQWTINDILRQFGPAYLKKFGNQMSQDQLKALRALQRCRQPEAGSVMYHCQGCNKVHHVPKACGNRHCPSCQGDKARTWLAQQQARLLPEKAQALQARELESKMLAQKLDQEKQQRVDVEKKQEKLEDKVARQAKEIESLVQEKQKLEQKLQELSHQLEQKENELEQEQAKSWWNKLTKNEQKAKKA